MTGKIKYDFHELRTRDRNTYAKLRDKENPQFRKRDIEITKKWTEKKVILNPNYWREVNRKRRTWTIDNCEICGRFIPLRNKKYCKDCRVIIGLLNGYTRFYLKRHPND